MAQQEKDKITKAAQAQKKDNEAAVSCFQVPCDVIDSDVTDDGMKRAQYVCAQ